MDSMTGQYRLSTVLAWFFAYPIFYVHHDKGKEPPKTWWSMISNPLEYALGSFGMRREGQTDVQNTPCLNLDQLDLHNVVEHDVSMTRHDFNQGDNHTAQADLIADLLASGNGKTITLDDFNQLRHRRYKAQKIVNPDLDFQDMRLQIACFEVALILKIFGDGNEVPVDYVKAFFKDGRLPREEGWKGVKTWWSLGAVEMHTFAGKIKKALGDPATPPAPFAAAS